MYIYKYKQFYISNKMLNAAWTLSSFPRLDKYIKEKVLWMPNLNYITRDFNKKLVLSVHDLSFIHFPYFFSLKRRLWHNLIPFKNMTARAAAIIADSESTKNDLVETVGVHENKIYTIPLGVDEIYFREDGDSNDSAFVKQLPAKFIAYVGAFEPRKNISALIYAFNKIADRDKEIELVLAGPIGWLARPLFNNIAQSPFTSRIKYLGYVSLEEKRHILQRASVFGFPSFYEGFGLPPLEAMAAGCPVVASSSGSLPEVLGDAAVLINPHQVNELAEALWQVLTSKKLALLLQEKGRQRAHQFNWNQTAEKTYNLFSKLNS